MELSYCHHVTCTFRCHHVKHDRISKMKKNLQVGAQNLSVTTTSSFCTDKLYSGHFDQVFFKKKLIYTAPMCLSRRD